MKNNKLKIGLLIDNYQVSAWFAAMVNQLIASDYASIEFVVVNNAPANLNNKESIKKGILAKSRKLCLALINKAADISYRALTEKSPAIVDAYCLVDLHPILDTISGIKVTAQRQKNTDTFAAADLDKIKAAQLDVIIQGGFRLLAGDILTIAKHGVWSFYHGDNQINRNDLPAYRQSLGDWSETTEIRLDKLTDDPDKPLVLYRSNSATDHMPVTTNKNKYYWKSVAFIPRVLKELHRLGSDAFYHKITKENQRLRYNANPAFTYPTTLEQARLVTKKISDKIKIFVNSNLYHQQWFLMYDLSPTLSYSFERYKKIMPPKDRFWADPHIIFKDKKYYIFIEEFLQTTKKGHISVIEMDEKGNYQAPVPVLEKDYHLSYPFVFIHEGEYYMIPETASNRTIELYKSAEFPFKWQWQMNLMENVYAVDTTLYFTKGKWWLFTNMVENEGASSLDELFLFHSHDFRSTGWRPHRKNPIISDVTQARPAGAIFEMDGNLYRPSQNCALRYGYAFNINLITILNDDDYQESRITEIKPNWNKNLLATHTFNKVADLQIIDVQANKFKFSGK